MKASVRQLYRQTADLTGQTLTIQGWVRTIRDQKQFGFISLNDGTFFLPLQEESRTFLPGCWSDI